MVTTPSSTHNIEQKDEEKQAQGSRYKEHENQTLSSAEGVQQGDPLGPLLFCLALHSYLLRLNSFCVAYMDDVTWRFFLQLYMIEQATILSIYIEAIASYFYRAP